MTIMLSDSEFIFIDTLLSTLNVSIDVPVVTALHIETTAPRVTYSPHQLHTSLKAVNSCCKMSLGCWLSMILVHWDQFEEILDHEKHSIQHIWGICHKRNQKKDISLDEAYDTALATQYVLERFKLNKEAGFAAEIAAEIARCLNDETAKLDVAVLRDIDLRRLPPPEPPLTDLWDSGSLFFGQPSLWSRINAYILRRPFDPPLN